MAHITRRGFVALAGIGTASLTLGGVLSACSANNQASDRSVQAGNTPESGQVIVAMNTGSEPAAGFDPFVSWGCGEHVHEPLIQSTLITTNTAMEFENDLATSYACSADGLTWTFGIRNDAKFTDGEALTAKDVAFTINGIIASEAAEADLSMVREAIAKTDTEVVIEMNKPYNALLYTLAVVGIVPVHAHDADYGSNPIGSGRYMLEQWDKGQQVILVANPNYYGEAPIIQRLVVVFMGEDAALAAANSNQIDIAFTSPIYSNQAISGYELLACKTVDSRGISLPTGQPGAMKADKSVEYPAGNVVTSDIAVRQAINYAVDREAMIKNVLNGYGTPAYSVSDNMPWSSTDMIIKTDVEKAKTLLSEAGWVAGADGILEKGNTRAAFDVLYASNDLIRQAISAEFANQMKGVGIEVTIKGGSWDDLYPHEFSSPILWGWGSNSPVEVYELNYSSGWGNYASYESKTVDGHLDEALRQSDIEASFEHWQKAQWDGTDGIAPQGAATWVWLVDVDHLYFKRQNLLVADQKLHPHGHGWSLVNNVDQWSWK